MERRASQGSLTCCSQGPWGPGKGEQGPPCPIFRSERLRSSQTWGPGCSQDDSESEGHGRCHECPLRSLGGISPAHCLEGAGVWAQTR